MKHLPLDDRPREKLKRLGVAGLGDNELLAIVLGSGTRQADSLALANGIIQASAGLHALPRFTCDELERVPGVGATKAAQVLAAIELGRRTLVRRAAVRIQFASPREVAEYLIPQYGTGPVEQFGILLLDTKHRLLRTTVISVGTLDSSLVHPREVFREAAAGRASSIVLFHNHPSGDPHPSREDLELTGRLIAAGELMGITVLDHIILGDSGYCSFKETGRL